MAFVTAPLSKTRCPPHSRVSPRRPNLPAATAATPAATPSPDRPAPSVSLVSLGCPKNVTDAEVFLGDLASRGISINPQTHPNAAVADADLDFADDFDLADAEFSDPHSALHQQQQLHPQQPEPQQRQQEQHEQQHPNSDVIVINTCAFVDDAKRESIDAILAATRRKQAGQASGVIVTGCLAQRYADQLADELPDVDAVIGFEHYDELPARVRQLAAGATSTTAVKKEDNSLTAGGLDRVRVGTPDVPFRPEHERVRLGPRHSVYVRLAEGCSHACTFCAIPGQFRGGFRSKPWEALTHEIAHLVSSGAKELVLIAEDTNQYGMDFARNNVDAHRLSHLLHHIADAHADRVHWVRLLYCYPSYFTDALIDAIARLDVVCKYIDMPLQHISDSVLRRMNRPGRAHTERLLHRLRAGIPGLTLRTTFIVGFPGETDAEHAELVAFVRASRFRHAGFFAYSEEEGTPATSLPDKVPAETAQFRRDELVSEQQRIEEELAAEMVGSVVDVMVDTMDAGHSVGRTRADAPEIDWRVHIVRQVEPGTVLPVRILGTSAFDLYGEPA